MAICAYGEKLLQAATSIRRDGRVSSSSSSSSYFILQNNIKQITIITVEYKNIGQKAVREAEYIITRSLKTVVKSGTGGSKGGGRGHGPPRHVGKRPECT